MTDPQTATMDGAFSDQAKESTAAEIGDNCESFLENYARGQVNCPGEEPPAEAFAEVNADHLFSGQWPAPEPPTEAQRVRELYQFNVLKELKHDLKVGFDRFAKLAAMICNTKICIVNFLDDKMQYTSNEVNVIPWLHHVAIPKSLSICAHTILIRSPTDIFEIPDTTKDWRFKGKPYVVGHPYIRFYAGAPLRTKTGQNIGSLCVLDYVPKKLTEEQIAGLRDLATMIMNDLDLHRERELANLRMRMANSVTHFTRGVAGRESTKEEKPMQLEDSAFPSNRARHRKRKSEAWVKRERSADRGSEDHEEGVMKFAEQQKGEKDVAETEAGMADLDDEEDYTETESTVSSAVDEVDLKAMYSYACRLMRETLDVEGVCFMDIDGIDWKQALLSLDGNAANSDTAERREFGASSSILGYSHSERFGAKQRDTWTSLSRWDEESEISNPQSFSEKASSRYAFARSASVGNETSMFHNPAYASIAGHLDDGSYISVRTGRQFDEGGFGNAFLAGFLLEHQEGKIFNEGLPPEVKKFLPDGVTSAILVPIYDFEQHPFAMTCAYSTNKQKWFTPVHSRYLDVLKKRIIMADRAKGVFISNISHELRSPLHGILASAEFIGDTPLDTLQRTFVDTIDSCGRTLLEVINHVLDFGKLTYIARLKNKVSRPHIQRSTSREIIPTQTIDVAPLDLMAITEQVVESCYAGYEFKGLFGQVDIGSLLGEVGPKHVLPRGQSGYGRAKDRTSALTVIIDMEYRGQGWFFTLQSGALQRILMNITGNALKYTSAGWVRVQLSTTEKEGLTVVHLTVSDSGKGISADFLKNRLFNPFSQEDMLQDGTGLGMSIVKQVVERLGGSINVTSQVGIGTQVFVQLPATPKPKPTDEEGYLRIRKLTRGLKVFLAGFDKRVPASCLLHDSITKYVTAWYGMHPVDDVYSSDIIISDECPELLGYFQQRTPSERSVFAITPRTDVPPTPESTASTHNVYRAWQPLIVLCSNALRYEFFGQQAETGKIIDFSSKPCGPAKLAKSLQFCLEKVEERRKSLEGNLSPTITSPALPTVQEDFAPQSPSSTFGHGVVRISPTVRRGSKDHSASMYIPGRGFVAAPTSSIVEPEQFPGVRRKSHFSPKSESEDPKWSTNGAPRSPPKAKPEEPLPSEAPERTRSVSPYNRRNPPRSVPIPAANSRNHFAVRVMTPGLHRPPNVLIVEDNPVNALILATFLKKRGFPFSKAENGLLAVQAVKARPKGFDVILMDIQMPVMDGSEATCAIRAIERERKTNPPAYIVALTGLAADKDRQMAFDAGIDHFLTKPVSLKQLGVVVDDWEKREAERGGLKSDFLSGGAQ